jgi:hypothetical protein
MVSFDVTYAVAGTYGCDDGKISPTRCAVIAAGLDGRWGPRPAVPSLQDALNATLRRRMAQRAARDHRAHPPLVGYSCERCLDALAFVVQPAPWGGEMGVCAACQETLADDAEPHARVSSDPTLTATSTFEPVSQNRPY